MSTLAKKMIAAGETEQLLHSDISLPEFIRKIEASPVFEMIPCSECSAYVRMDGGNQPGRCKKLGFWFPENFSCGYGEANEQRRRLRF